MLRAGFVNSTYVMFIVLLSNMLHMGLVDSMLCIVVAVSIMLCADLVDIIIMSFTVVIM